MRQGPIFITRTDRSRLVELIQRTLREGGRDVAHLRGLGDELERAQVVEPKEIPADVVTMNSTVRISDLDSGERFTYTLVYPENADIDGGRLSVLAAIGTALLGYRVGDEIEWTVPAGTRRVRIDELKFQPEAAGAFHL